MRRFYFKSITIIILGFVVMLSVSICGIYMWKLKDWEELKYALRLKEKRNFSILELMGSTNVYEVVKPDIPTILMQPENPFAEPAGNPSEMEIKRPFATILVISMAKYFNQRHIIRNTWYKWASRLNIRIFFVIGFHNGGDELFKILSEEHKRHNDLIVDDYEEGYYKLPGKVLRMLKWYNSTYTDETSPRFLVKTDQDVFLNLPNIVASLVKTSYYKSLMSQAKVNCVIEQSTYESVSTSSKNHSYCPIPDKVNLQLDLEDPETYFIGGKRFENAEIEKDPDSKWYIDSSERERLNWSSIYFPTYLNGPCYIISGNAVKSIYETSFQVPIYPFEDVYVVGLVASDRLNLHISNLRGMHLDFGNPFGYGMFISMVRKRSRLGKILAMHPVAHPSLMRKLCRRIESCHELMISKGSKREIDPILFLSLLSIFLLYFYI